MALDTPRHPRTRARKQLTEHAKQIIRQASTRMTIAEIVHEFGVSQATVSRVCRDVPGRQLQKVGRPRRS